LTSSPLPEGAELVWSAAQYLAPPRTVEQRVFSWLALMKNTSGLVQELRTVLSPLPIPFRAYNSFSFSGDSPGRAGSGFCLRPHQPLPSATRSFPLQLLTFSLNRRLRLDNTGFDFFPAGSLVLAVFPLTIENGLSTLLVL